MTFSGYLMGSECNSLSVLGGTIAYILVHDASWFIRVVSGGGIRGKQVNY